jgi:hypothetical protein
MKTMGIVLVLMSVSVHICAKQNIQWVHKDASIEFVFDISNSYKEREFIRLYDDGTYEHLNYHSKSYDKEEVQFNHGRYEMLNNKIVFHQPEIQNFNGKFCFGSYYYNGKIYKSLFDMKLRPKKQAFQRTVKKEFFKPFYIGFNSDVIVSNSEAADQLDLERLVQYLVSAKNKEQEKVMAIVEFIVKSVEYDHKGRKSKNYSNKQNDTKSILAGNNRLAVCAGYAAIFAELCKIAGIECHEISGYTKYSFSSISRLGGYHAWNIVVIDGVQQLFDVTWADNGKYLDMKWINVDPQIMIGSHFPDKKDHQLLSTPVSQKDFLNRPIILPLTGSAAPVSINIASHQFVTNTFRIALPGRQTIKVASYPSTLIDNVYTKEGGKPITYSRKYIGKGHYDGDSTYYLVTLSDPINVLSIEINNQIEIKTIVYKGNENDLLNYYIKNADRRYSESYVKAIIASIKLSDTDQLKELLGDAHVNFFDKKGNLKLDKKVIDACSNWSGELSLLINGKHISVQIGRNGERQEETSYNTYMEIPKMVRFNLEYDGTIYTISKIDSL